LIKRFLTLLLALSFSCPVFGSGFATGGGLSDGIRLAIREVENTYSETVSVDAKKKSLFKFGASTSAGTTASTVWAQGGTVF